nr:MAG TPA: hypothetical protein [Caudoviricetes sp.]
MNFIGSKAVSQFEKCTVFKGKWLHFCPFDIE